MLSTQALSFVVAFSFFVGIGLTLGYGFCIFCRRGFLNVFKKFKKNIR